MKKADVFLKTKTAVVSYDSNRVSVETMTSAVRDAGYDVSGESEPRKMDNKPDSEPRERGDRIVEKKGSPSGGNRFFQLTAPELRQRLDREELVLVNVHTPYAGELPNTDIFIPYNGIQDNLDKLPSSKNVGIVVYCVGGHMSVMAAGELVNLGFTRVYNLMGGMNAWKKSGYELIHR